MIRIIGLLLLTLTSCIENTGSAEGRSLTSHDDVEVIESGSIPIEDIVETESEVTETESVVPETENVTGMESDITEAETETEDAQSDEEEIYVPDTKLVLTAQLRLIELLQDPDYLRNNGKPNRTKIARKLNKEGYRKSDGSKFKRRDIPK